MHRQEVAEPLHCWQDNEHQMDFSDNRREDASRRLTSLAVVALLHVAMVYVLVTGLARKMVDVVKAPIETKIIEDVKPPPPDAPPPPPPKFAPPPAFIPPPEVNIQVPLAAQQNVITAVTRTPQPVQPAQRQPVQPVQRQPAATSVRVPPVIDAARSCVKPEYPAASRRNEETGAVTLSFLIGVDGKVVESKVESSSGFARLDEAARKALSLCQFKAGTVDGKPEQSWAILKYLWQME